MHTRISFLKSMEVSHILKAYSFLMKDEVFAGLRKRTSFYVSLLEEKNGRLKCKHCTVKIEMLKENK